MSEIKTLEVEVTHPDILDVDVDFGQTLTITKPSHLQDKEVVPSSTEQVVIADANYDGLSSVAVKSIDSDYVGPAIPRRADTDLVSSGDTIEVPNGYFEANVSKAVQTGQAGTPTASKGIVTEHSVDITPTVSNTEGYILSETIVGSPITITATELVSGTQNITANGVYDVANDRNVSVAVDYDTSKYSEHTLTLIFDDDTQLDTTILLENEGEE